MEPVAEADVLLRRLSSVSGDTGMRAVLMDMGQAVVAIATPPSTWRVVLAWERGGRHREHAVRADHDE